MVPKYFRNVLKFEIYLSLFLYYRVAFYQKERENYKFSTPLSSLIDEMKCHVRIGLLFPSKEQLIIWTTRNQSKKFNQLSLIIKLLLHYTIRNRIQILYWGDRRRLQNMVKLMNRYHWQNQFLLTNIFSLVWRTRTARYIRLKMDFWTLECFIWKGLY